MIALEHLGCRKWGVLLDPATWVTVASCWRRHPGGHLLAWRAWRCARRLAAS